jgi:S-adenosylmethionine decarboxylase
VRRAQRLDDEGAVARFLHDVVQAIGMSVLAGPVTTREDGPPERSGCSGVVILHESHAAIHTYPWIAAAFVDVFSCRRFEPVKVSEVLRAHFGAHEIAEQDVKDRGRHWGADLAAELGGWRQRR